MAQPKGNAIISLRDALKLANSFEPQDKLLGLERLREIVLADDSQLVDYGYDQVLLKELLKFVKFEEDQCLRATLDLVLAYYAPKETYQDDIMETLLYRYGMSTNDQVSLMCLAAISSQIDSMGDNLAKHSRQLLQLTDITLPNLLSEQVRIILEKMEPKLPKRRLVN